MPTREEVFEALHQVEDPELGMDIVELGLVYDVEIEGPKVKVIHSLTSMGCPAGPMIQEDIDGDHARELPGRRERRARADLGPALDSRAHVRRRQVHPRLRLETSRIPRLSPPRRSLASCETAVVFSSCLQLRGGCNEEASSARRGPVCRRGCCRGDGRYRAGRHDRRQPGTVDPGGHRRCQPG